MIDVKAFAAMKDGVAFVNIGRGLCVDEQALIENLRSGKVAFAALDVARGNVRELFVGDQRVAFHVADVLAEPYAGPRGPYDLIAANPPYIPAGMIPREPEVRDFEPTAWMDAKAARRGEPAMYYGVEGWASRIYGDAIRNIYSSSIVNTIQCY